MFCALLLQTSIFVAPLHLSEEVPDSRAARGILVLHREIKGVAPSEKRTPAEARAWAEQLREQLLAGTEFEALARAHSGDRSATQGGVLGTFFPGVLSPEVDAFLFQAEVGAISPVLDSPRGFQIVQRIDRDAGCLHIQLEGPDARARAQDLLLRLEGGADFSDLARQFSAEKDSAGRGGQWGMFQRSAADSLLRAACFQIPVGGVAAPIESPRGIHLIKRVPPQDIDPALADDVVARVRCILVAFDGAAFASPLVTRRHSQAEALARELAEKIRQGADMAELAREHDDDRGGRARAGDLGWIRRYSPTIPAFMDRVFSEPKGTLLGPIPSEVGWVLLRRER